MKQLFNTGRKLVANKKPIGHIYHKIIENNFTDVKIESHFVSYGNDAVQRTTVISIEMLEAEINRGNIILCLTLEEIQNVLIPPNVPVIIISNVK